MNGTVDLIGPVQYEISENTIFSVGNICYVIFSLYCQRENYGNFSGSAGKLTKIHIGILEDSKVEYYLSFFIEEIGSDVTVQKFTSTADMLTAFHNGEIDLIVDGGSRVTTGEEVRLALIGQASERFMTTKNHKLLLENLKLGEMIWSGKADVAFVVYTEGKYSSTVYFTNEIDQELLVAIISHEIEKFPKSELVTVGLIHTFNGMPSYLKIYKPTWSQKFYNTVDDCLEALERKECDVAFGPARILQRENTLSTHP